MTLGGRTVAGLLHPPANCPLNADVVDYRRPSICRETVCGVGRLLGMSSVVMVHF